MDTTLALAELHDGEFFGEMAILDEQPRSADATVLTNTRLAVLSRDDFRNFLHANPDIALGILTAMIHRLRRTDELLRHRVSRNANEEEAARLTMADRAADKSRSLAAAGNSSARPSPFVFSGSH